MNTETQEQPARTALHERSSLFLQIGLLVVITALTFLAYSPVMFNFFNGDDFVHLTWLSKAIHQPELVLRNFYTSWLDGTTTKFYRPLISVFMVSDYALYGLNGMGFRLTNLIFHLSSTVFIFLICKQLQAKTFAEQRLTWPFFSAALFALYPLHPEAVSWITGRVDSVVTAFCLGALYFYICFSETKKLLFLTLSLVSSALGLLSKEMAITLPAVFCFYELVYNVFEGASPQKLRLKSLLCTAPFFLLLAVYFVIRLLALGTFVGGYDNNLTFISNPKEFIKGWVHGLLMLLVPINRALMGSHHILSKVYPAMVGISSLAAIISAVIEPRNKKHLSFLAGWLVLCLLPVYKLFNIADDLQGSRLAYLATVPLCMILSAGVLGSVKLEKIRLWAGFCKLQLVLLVGLAAFLLWTNNQPWRKCGEESNAIRAQLQSLYDKLDGDPEVLFLGLPDQIEGAYTCRNSLDGMTKKPQLSRDITKCLMVNAFDPIFPFGYLKDSIAESGDKLLVFRWVSADKQFKKVDISKSVENSASSNWSGESLKACASVPEQKSKPELSFADDGSLILKTSKTGQYLLLDLGKRSCFDCDFVEVNLELAEAAGVDTAADLLYSNDMYPDFKLRRRAHAHFIAGQKKQRLIFAMRGLPEWSLGGDTRAFEFLLPGQVTAKIESIAILPAAQVMPRTSFPNSGYFGSKGYIHLTEKDPNVFIDVDLSKVAGAKRFALEITRTNLLFEEQNPQIRSKVADAWREVDSLSMRIELKFADFKSAGLYEIRVFPLSSDGTICGAASDHIAISVDPKS